MAAITSQDIRELVWITPDTTVLDLSRILQWTPARTQKEIYLNGGGIVSNASPVDFHTAQVLIRQAGLEAARPGEQVQIHCVEDLAPEPETEPPFWKQRIKYWLSTAVELFSIPGRFPMETALVLTDAAVTQLILGARYASSASGDSVIAIEGETPRFEWREILAQFSLPSGGPLDPIETAFLNDLHASRNDVIHNLAPFILNRDSVYIWVFLALSLASQLHAAPGPNTPGLTHFMPAMPEAGLEIREGSVRWLHDFIPSLLETALGPIQVQDNLGGNLGTVDDLGRAFIPDLVITDQAGRRYSALVEIPKTLNSLTAQWWAYYQPGFVFIPLGYLSHARYLARRSGYPEDRLIAYISPNLTSPMDRPD